MINKKSRDIKTYIFMYIMTFISLFFILSCQSGKQSLITKKQLPKSVSFCFGSCENISGASNVQVYVKDKLKSSFDVEWSKDTKEFKIVFYNSLGQDLSYLNYNESNKTIDTNINEIVPYKISVDDEGYLNVNGYTVPIGINELPCILGYKYPNSWLKEQGISKVKNRYIWEVDEDIRDISSDITVKKNKIKTNNNKKNKNNKNKNQNLDKNEGINSYKIHSCSTIKWRTFLFFHSYIKICYEDSKYMILDFNDYILKFTNID